LSPMKSDLRDQKVNRFLVSGTSFACRGDASAESPGAQRQKSGLGPVRLLGRILGILRGFVGGFDDLR